MIENYAIPSVSGLKPDAAVVVATVRALKSHSGRFKIVAGKPLDPGLTQENIPALEEGCSPEEILEAIEISMPEAGVVAFQEGFNAWAEVVGAPALEPSVDVAGNRNSNSNSNKEED